MIGFEDLSLIVRFIFDQVWSICLYLELLLLHCSGRRGATGVQDNWVYLVLDLSGLISQLSAGEMWFIT